MTNNLSDTIQNLLLSGKSYNYIIDLLASGKITDGDKFTKSQARNAIYLIKKQMKATFNENREYLESDLYEKFENLYAKSYEAGDFKECRECLKDIMKLSGIGTNSVTVAKDKNQNELIQINFS